MADASPQDDLRGRISPAVWKPVLARAFRERAAIAGLVGGGILVAAIETALPLFVARIVDEAREGEGAVLWPILAAYAGVFVVFGAGVLLFIRSAGLVSTRTAHALRRDAFARLQALEPAYFDLRPTG